MMNGYGAHGWGMGWWWIIGIILLVILVWAIIRALNPNKTTPPEKSPIEILKERYAKGEINKQEFEERKKDLLSRS